MGMSPYVARIRAAIGHDLLLSPSACAIIHNERGEVQDVVQSEGPSHRAVFPLTTDLEVVGPGAV